MTVEEQFEIFWKSYPRRVAKGNARTAFAKAIKKTTLQAMQAAIVEYVARKPERIDFKHPATWLNSECWSDEWPILAAQTNHNNFRRETIADVAREFIEGSNRDHRAPIGISQFGRH